MSFLCRWGSSVIANYAYDMLGSFAFALGAFAFTASMVQMFQIGKMRLHIGILEGRIETLDGDSDSNAEEAT